MNDKFTVDLNNLAQTVSTERVYKLSDVQHRIKKVAYDLVRFRDNEDTEQLWKIEERSDGPVIVALYGDDGGLVTESVANDWEAIPDKVAMHIFYKGEPLASLNSKDLGIPTSEFELASTWLPKKLSSDESLQKSLFTKIAKTSRDLISKRFPELTKVAQLNTDPINSFEDEDDVDMMPDETSGNLDMNEIAYKLKANLTPKELEDLVRLVTE